MWGFSVEAELVENSEKQDELCCYVSRVEERSVAMNSGKKGQFRANNNIIYCGKKGLLRNNYFIV
jgi:hypothetical protein